jgi:hypothetical protein
MEMVNRGESGAYRLSNPSTLGRNRPGPSDAEVHLLSGFPSVCFRGSIAFRVLRFLPWQVLIFDLAAPDHE